jgi:formate dehydrogenase maturation protein FdhE
VYASSLPAGLDCPWCRREPQVGCLTTEGDGQALSLVCGLCFRRRRAVRDRCPDCGERNDRKLVTFSTAEFLHLRVRACDGCKGYFLLVDLEKELAAIPEVDEIAGLGLTLWAAGAGYRRMLTNIAGI